MGISEMREAEHNDRIILALRAKYREKQQEKQQVGEDMQIGVNKVLLKRTTMFEEECSMLLPTTMEDMPYPERVVKYRDKNRPPVIKTVPDRTAAISFDKFMENDFNVGNSGIEQKLERLRCNMKKVWKQNVFYDTGEVQGENMPVAWMDYKSFCLNGNFYAILFLFDTEKEVVMGNFHCSFSQYDIWKPAVLKLLSTVRIR